MPHGTRMNSIDKLLNKYYYDISEPSSYTSLNNIYKSLLNSKYKINKNDIRKWLLQQETYGVHHKPVFKFKRNSIIAKYIDSNWQADLIEIKHPKTNHNFRYVLMVIDTLSKYGWAIPLHNKSGPTVKKAFLKIFNSSKRKPQILTTDA